MIKLINDADFSQVMNAPVALLAFEAPWCTACKAILPTLQKLASQYNTIKFYRVDVSVSPQLANRYMVRTLPTLLLLQHGQPIDARVGAVSADEIVGLLSNRNRSK